MVILKEKRRFCIAAKIPIRAFIAVWLKIPRMDIGTYFTDYIVGKMVNEKLQ